MTIDEFLERLAELHRYWTVNSGLIRCQRSQDCPVSAVTRNKDDFSDPIAAAISLGLSTEDARSIVHSADNNQGGRYFSEDIRSRLLKACGLTEEVS